MQCPRQTDRPSVADLHAYFKVELWTKDGCKIQRMLWAGNGIEKARSIFKEAVKRRPRGRYTIRQYTCVLEKCPE
jgi:hypothetical protein